MDRNEFDELLRRFNEKYAGDLHANQRGFIRHFALHHDNGRFYSWPEIAAHTGVSVGRVSQYATDFYRDLEIPGDTNEAKRDRLRHFAFTLVERERLQTEIERRRQEFVAAWLEELLSRLARNPEIAPTDPISQIPAGGRNLPGPWVPPGTTPPIEIETWRTFLQRHMSGFFRLVAAGLVTIGLWQGVSWLAGRWTTQAETASARPADVSTVVAEPTLSNADIVSTAVAQLKGDLVRTAPIASPTGAAAPTPSKPTSIPTTSISSGGSAPQVQATSQPTATPTTAAITPPETVLAFGQMWRGDGLLLTATGPVHSTHISSEWSTWTDRCRINYTGGPTVQFVLKNMTGSLLNFQAAQSSFSLVLSTGKRYPGCIARNGYVAFDDLQSGKDKQFLVYFDVTWNDFQADKRNSQVAHYRVVVESLHQRLPLAVWQEMITH